MIRSRLKSRHSRLQRTSKNLGERTAPLIVDELKKAAEREMTPKEELRFLEGFMELVEAHPPGPEYNIGREIRAIKKCIRELKATTS
jgi:hypothetical protein